MIKEIIEDKIEEIKHLLRTNTTMENSYVCYGEENNFKWCIEIPDEYIEDI